MLSTRGRLGWALAAVILITACGGGTSTSGGATSTPSSCEASSFTALR